MRVRWLAMVLPVCLAAPAASAYNGWGLNGAYWDTSDADSAFGPGGKVSIELAEGIQIELRLSYFGSLGEDREGAEVDLDVLPAEGGLALTGAVSDSLQVFGGAGVGYYFMDGSVELPTGVEAAGAEPDDELGFYVAAGVEWAVTTSKAFYGKTQAALFAEVMYRSVEADGMKIEGSAGDIQLGGADLDGLGVNVGLMVKW